MKQTQQAGIGLLILSAIIFAPAATFAQVGATVVGDTSVGIGEAVDASVTTSADVNVSDSASTSTQGEVAAETNTDSSLKVNESGIAVVSALQVGTDADLNIFSSNVKAKDKSVERLDINSGPDGTSKVKVVYRHKGKLLGIFPVTIKSTTTVEGSANEEVKVNSGLSWWGFLVSNKNYAKADLESKIKQNATVKTYAKANATAQAKAQVAEAVISEVEANARAEFKVEN
jgi:hypothetical protein